MKKIIAICLALVIAAGSTLTVFAAPGSFWYSPSGRPAPIVIEFDPSNDACTAKLVITPYSDRDTLTDTLRTLIEKAYKTIAGTKDLTELNADLSSLVAAKGLDAKYLAVSDLFDIHVTGCTYHEGHVDFDITLAADHLQNFVALLHMNEDGVWELVADAHVENNEHLVFSVDDFSPFAIVVDTTGEPPQTGDSVMIVCTVVMFAAIIALACVMHKRKKQIAQ